MAPKIPSAISCSSIELLEHELDTIRSGLELRESEDTWDKINNALLRLNAVVVGSAADYPFQIISSSKESAQPIIISLNSERSRLSGCATDLITNLATNLQHSFETLIPLFVPTVLALASRSNKIFVTRAKNCLLSIVEYCGSPAILPLLRHSVMHKSITLRQTTIDVVVACLNSFNPPDLESKNRVEDIEAIIRATARDSNPDVRKSSRKAFDAYKVLFPARLDAFIAPLTPTMKKYLDIKATNQRKPLLLSSSASAPSVPSAAVPPIKQSTDILSRSHAPSQGHGKSNSTSSATTSSGTTFTRVERAAKSAKPPSAKANSKPPSSGPATGTEPMPPPPASQKSSSGPVRPPLGMRPAMLATSAAPSSRPFPGRQASRMNLKALSSAALDITKSQPVTHGEVEQREKGSAPAVRSAAGDPIQPKPVEVEPFTKRSTGGPRRVPKPEGVVTSSNAARTASVPQPAAQKPAEGLCDSAKGMEKEKPTSSSAPSTVTTREQKPVFTRPQEPVALAQTKVGAKDKGRVKELVRDFEMPLQGEEEREREPCKRSESRSGELRPSSRAENGHRRTDSQEQEVCSRPASRMDGQVLQRPASRAVRPPSRMNGDAHHRPPSRTERPASRMEGEAPFRLESRAAPKGPESRAEEVEMKAIGAAKRPEEEVNVQVRQAGPQKAVDLEALARREERRRRRAAEKAALEARAHSDALAQARREEKRKRREQAAAQAAMAQQNPPQAEAVIDPAVAARREGKKRQRELAADQQQQALLQIQSQGKGEAAVDPAAATKLEERARPREEHEAACAAEKRPRDGKADHEKPAKKRRGEANSAIQRELSGMQADARKAAKQLKLAAMAAEREPDEGDGRAPVRTEEVEVQPPPTTDQECSSQDLALTTDRSLGGPPNPTSSSNEEEVHRVPPLAPDASHPTGGPESAQLKTPPRLVSNTGHASDSRVRPLVIHKAALVTPLPPSPPAEAYVSKPFETPAPLRRAIASRRYQAPATPISRLLDTIQYGFYPDFNAIGEDLGFSSVPQEAQVNDVEPAYQRAANNDTVSEGTTSGGQIQPVFVDTRRRKLKSSRTKEKEIEKHKPRRAEGRPPLKAQNR